MQSNEDVGTQSRLMDLLKPKDTSYYGTKYGTFEWVRGTIDIYDQDDVEYVELCLEKMKLRFTEEAEEKEKENKKGKKK